jgi:type I restriction enzyme R subunit
MGFKIYKHMLNSIYEFISDGVCVNEIIYNDSGLPIDYRILIVANKFQTGFDQPLLHTMYVDKKLGGVNAVQTLSRLNRIHPEKHDTMVLDFANDAEDIQKSFENFHVKTTLSEGTDPNKLHDYEDALKDFRIFTEDDVEKFAQEYFSTSGTQAKLYSILEPVIQELESRPEEERKDFKKQMQSFTRLYAFLSHIMTFRDTELEKLYQFSRFLVKKLKIGYKRLPTEILDSVDLESLRISEDSKGSIVLTDKEGELKPISDMGTGSTREEDLAPLSEILNELNERFGTEFTEDDRVAQVIEDMRDRLLKTDKLQRAANPEINSKDNFAKTFERFFDEEIENLINTSLDLYTKMSDDGELRHNVKQALLKDIYSKLVEADNRRI